MIRQLVGPDTEPVYSTYFTRRLEAFNDIVFGFSLSLLASQLQSPNYDHLSRFFLSLIVFLATFALMAGLWYNHYRTFHYGFAAKRIDVFLNFALLACAALVPYTFQLTVVPHYATSAEAQISFLPYGIVFATVYTINAILKFRGLKAFGDRLEPAQQLKQFKSAAISAVVPLFVLFGLLLVETVGPIGYAGFGLLSVAGLFMRGIREVPSRFLPAT
jgi:uncharacterized membrane protein